MSSVKIDIKQTTLRNAILGLRKELDYLIKFDDIFALILYRIDGLLITAHYSEKPSYQLLSLASWITKIISKISQELNVGVESVKYSKQGVPVFFYRAGQTAILAAILNPYSNYGLLQMELNKTAFNVGKIIDVEL